MCGVILILGQLPMGPFHTFGFRIKDFIICRFALWMRSGTSLWDGSLH